MSNTYNNELEIALKQVNDQLDTAELKESNSEDSAKINLYYAHGMTEKSSDKLNSDQDKSDVAGVQYHAATSTTQVCNNIVSDANAAALDAGDTTSTVSTAATSFQTAANALTNLWSETASVLAIATSVENNDKIQQMALKSNALAEIAAKGAEKASLVSLNTTIEASQSRAANVVTQAGIVKTDMANLEGVLNTGFSTLQDQVSTDLDDLSAAVQVESQMAGIFHLANVEEDALKATAAFMNEKVNNNLLWTPDEDGLGNKFTLSFDRYKEIQADINTDPCKKTDDKTPTEQAIAEYRLMLVNSDEASSFDIQMAKSVSFLEGKENPKFVSIKLPEDKPREEYKIEYCLTEYFSRNPEQKKSHALNVAYDYMGKPVKKGSPYSFFVYVVYTHGYQVMSNDTDGYLSLSSDSFTNATILPNPDPGKEINCCQTTDKILLTFGQSGESNTAKISFKVPKTLMQYENGMDLDMYMEFRVFLMSETNQKALCANLEINKGIQAVNDMKKAQNDADESLELAKLKYNEAATNLAMGVEDADKADLKALKSDIETNQEALHLAQINYRISVVQLNNLYVNKISDFYVDEEILGDVPSAYSLTAKREATNDYLAKLKKEKEELVKRESQIKNNKSQTEEKIAKDRSKIITLEDEVKKNDIRLLKLNEDRSVLQNNIASEIEELLKISGSGETITKVSQLKEIEKQSSVDDKSRVKELVTQIIKDWKELETISASISELMKINLKVNAEINHLSSEITIGNIEDHMYDDETILLPLKIANLNNEILFYETKEKSSDDFFYVAEDDKGDFTDNYGEMLSINKPYTALVLSVVKPNHPDLKTSFTQVCSKFSNTTVLPQIKLTDKN